MKAIIVSVLVLALSIHAVRVDAQAKVESRAPKFPAHANANANANVNTNACAAARGACINTETTKCDGVLHPKLCVGRFKCCVMPVYPNAKLMLPPHTNDRIVVDAVDNGKVSWTQNVKRKKFKRMTMGRLKESTPNKNFKKF